MKSKKREKLTNPGEFRFNKKAGVHLTFVSENNSNNKIMKAINNTADFNKLMNQDKPVLLDFYADWCGPCQALLPTVEKLAEKHKADFEIVKVNVDSNPELSRQFKVRSIPALFFIKDKMVVEQLNGVQMEAVLEAKIESHKNLAA